MPETENTDQKPEMTVQERLIQESIQKNQTRSTEAYAFLLENDAVEDVTSEEQEADIKARYGIFAEGEIGSRIFQFSGLRLQGSTWKANQALFHLLAQGRIGGRKFTHHPETSWKNLQPGDTVLISQNSETVSLATVDEVISGKDGSFVKVSGVAKPTANWHQVHHITFS